MSENANPTQPVEQEIDVTEIIERIEKLETENSSLKEEIKTLRTDLDALDDVVSQIGG